MKIYTRTGDKGTTSLVGGTRVPKNHPRLDAYGTVDELNSWIGLVIASSDASVTPLAATDRDDLIWIQNRLFDLGCQLATEPESRWQPKQITDDDVARLEGSIDRIDATLPAHNAFILPGGTLPSAHAQVARTIARRAERLMVTLAGETTLAPEPMLFVNRLSDYLFVLARHLNHIAGQADMYWE